VTYSAVSCHSPYPPTAILCVLINVRPLGMSSITVNRNSKMVPREGGWFAPTRIRNIRVSVTPAPTGIFGSSDAAYGPRGVKVTSLDAMAAPLGETTSIFLRITGTDSVFWIISTANLLSAGEVVIHTFASSFASSFCQRSRCSRRVTKAKYAASTDATVATAVSIKFSESPKRRISGPGEPFFKSFSTVALLRKAA